MHMFQRQRFVNFYEGVSSVKTTFPPRRSALEEGSGERSFKMATTSASRIVCSRFPFSEKERKEKRVPACNCLFCFVFTRSHLLRAWNRLSVEPEEKQGEIIFRANIVCSTFIQFVCCSQSAIQRFWRVSSTNVKREGWNTPYALFIALKWRNHPRPSQKRPYTFYIFKINFLTH